MPERPLQSLQGPDQQRRPGRKWIYCEKRYHTQQIRRRLSVSLMSLIPFVQLVDPFGKLVLPIAWRSPTSDSLTAITEEMGYIIVAGKRINLTGVPGSFLLYV